MAANSVGLISFMAATTRARLRGGEEAAGVDATRAAGLATQRRRRVAAAAAAA
jgi:hypothetical protein